MRNWIAQARQHHPILFWIVMILLILPALMGLYEGILIGLFWVYWQVFGGMTEETIDNTVYILICVGIILSIATVIWLGRLRPR